MELLVFSDVYLLNEEKMKSDAPIWVKGMLQKETEGGIPKLRVSEVADLQSLVCRKVKAIRFRMAPPDNGPGVLKVLKELIESHPGDCQIKLSVEVNGHKILLDLGESNCVGLEESFLLGARRLASHGIVLG